MNQNIQQKNESQPSTELPLVLKIYIFIGIAFVIFLAFDAHFTFSAIVASVVTTLFLLAMLSMKKWSLYIFLFLGLVFIAITLIQNDFQWINIVALITNTFFMVYFWKIRDRFY